jgi:hypothetical protein
LVAGVKTTERKLKRMVNKSLRIEGLLKDGLPMGRGLKVEGKKSKRYEDD